MKSWDANQFTCMCCAPTIVCLSFLFSPLFFTVSFPFLSFSFFLSLFFCWLFLFPLYPYASRCNYNGSIAFCFFFSFYY